LLGRNILFEFVKRGMGQKSDDRYILLGRGSANSSFSARVDELLDTDCVQYLAKDKKYIEASIKPKVMACEYDLEQFEGNGSWAPTHIDLLLHVASRTDFRHGSAVQDKLEKTNVEGTRRLLETFKGVQIGRMAYVSSAYVCGHATGTISPYFMNTEGTFRNPYEKTKLQSELLWRLEADRRNIPCIIYRPSTIAGRMMEQPQGHTCKFDVFYEFMRWLIRQKCKVLGYENIYERSVDLDLRIHINSESGLNIIPADCAAKMIVSSLSGSTSGFNMHVANRGETPHRAYIRWMLEYLNISGPSFVESMPTNRNNLEKRYYRSVGRIYTPYVTSPPMEFGSEPDSFDQDVMQCPDINAENFKTLLNFAKKSNFGLTQAQI